MNAPKKDIWECVLGFVGARKWPFLVINGADGIAFHDTETCTLAASAPDLRDTLMDARQAIYCYEQDLLAQCREDAAKLQFERIKRIDEVLKKADGR